MNSNHKKEIASVNCSDCDFSQYGGYADGVKEYCLLHDKDLESIGSLTKPCRECNGKDFKEDTW